MWLPLYSQWPFNIKQICYTDLEQSLQAFFYESIQVVGLFKHAFLLWLVSPWLRITHCRWLNLKNLLRGITLAPGHSRHSNSRQSHLKTDPNVCFKTSSVIKQLWLEINFRYILTIVSWVWQWHPQTSKLLSFWKWVGNDYYQVAIAGDYASIWLPSISQPESTFLLKREAGNDYYDSLSKESCVYGSVVS